MRKILLSPPELAGNELELLREALASGWIAPLGPAVDAFEAELAAQLDMPYALATSSGTAALHLALAAARIGPGDEVWLSTLTFAATANAVAYVGATPVFVDSDASWMIDAARVASELDRTPKPPRALITVDLYGHCADHEPIVAACRRRGVLVIEDAAEALGATCGGRPAGSFGDLSILSFNGNKIITTSGGGMLLGRSRELLERARYLATQARAPVAHYEHTEVGYNYRLSNLLAAIGRAQLADLPRRVDARRAIHEAYVAGLGDLPGWAFLRERPQQRATHWLTCATIDPAVAGADRDRVIAALAGEGIEARAVWKPMHLQPAFATAPSFGGSVAGALFERGLCLPSGSSMTPDDVARVIDAVRRESRRGG